MKRKPARPGPRTGMHRGASITVLILAVLAAIVTHAPALHLLGSKTYRDYPASGPSAAVAAVFLTGDVGFDIGMNSPIARRLADHGISVVAVSSPVAFARYRTRAQAQAIVVNAIDRALDRTGAKRVVLIGESFGADIVATIAPDLPAGLRGRIAAIGMIVPAREVYYRADPSGLAYLGEPDARPEKALRRLDWAPVFCIYGVKERDSLCPSMKGGAAQVIGLPGGHYLERNSARLTATMLRALRAADPAAGVRS